MKIIEGLKKIQELQKKAEDLREKIGAHSVHLDFETTAYPDQKAQVKEWLQVHSDVLKAVLHLRLAIQKTNLETNVTIELNGKAITKPIAAWIHRRRDLAKLELDAWKKLTDKNMKETGIIQQSDGTKREVKLIRDYDAPERDKMQELFTAEPMTIDSRLEVVNAVTDLIE